jgi:hypothetical protein
MITVKQGRFRLRDQRLAVNCYTSPVRRDRSNPNRFYNPGHAREDPICTTGTSQLIAKHYLAAATSPTLASCIIWDTQGEIQSVRLVSRS